MSFMGRCFTILSIVAKMRIVITFDLMRSSHSGGFS